LGLRAAWLQLSPEKFVWERGAAEGVVSHRSAAALFDLGHLPADRHDFIVATRHQTRRSDVRLHTRVMRDSDWDNLRGLTVTRPSRIASDLLWDTEDPQAVAQVVADALHNADDYPGAFAEALALHAARFGLRRGDGIALLEWLLDLAARRETSAWLDQARAHRERSSAAESSAADAKLLRSARYSVQ
jgi:hypothetical protein